MASAQGDYHGGLGEVLRGIGRQAELAAYLKRVSGEQHERVALALGKCAEVIGLIHEINRCQEEIPSVQAQGLEAARTTEAAFHTAFPNHAGKIVLEVLAAGLAGTIRDWNAVTRATGKYNLALEATTIRTAAVMTGLGAADHITPLLTDQYVKLETRSQELGQQIRMQEGNT